MARDETARDVDTETSTVDRRSYVKTVGTAALASLVFGSADSAAKPKNSSTKTSGEFRDVESKLHEYKPEVGAKFFATDTARIFLGDGREWNRIDSSGPTPSVDSVTANEVSVDRFEQSDSFIVYERDGQARALNAQTQTEEYAGDAASAIQYAIDTLPSASGGTVRLKSGTFVCDSQITFDASTHLVGSGNDTQIKAADGLNSDLLVIPSGTDHARISNLKIHGNGANNSSGDCLRIEPSWRVVLDHLVVRHGAAHGIHFPDVSDDSYEPVVFDTDVARCGGDGYRLSSAIDLFGVDVYAEANDGHGIVIDSPGQVHVHPHAYASGADAGVLVTANAGDTRLLAPWAENNRRHGMVVRGDRTTVLNPYVYNNGQAESGRYDGIALDANGCTVTGGVFNDFGDPIQRHHINERDETYSNIVAHNQLLNCVGSPISRFPYSDTIIRDNQGYTVESGGETTVADGGAVNHGLDETPVAYSVTANASGVVASVRNVDSDALTVELLNVSDGSSVTDSVTVSWTAKGPSAL